MGLKHPGANHFWTCKYCSNGGHLYGVYCRSLNCCCPQLECQKSRDETLREIISKREFWKGYFKPKPTT